MKREERRTLDVLIPVYRPDAKLGHLLHMLNRQRSLPQKIVLMVTAEEGEKETEREAAQQGKAKRRPEALLARWISESVIPVECQFLSKKEFDHGGTRNAGMAFCDSEFVLCMTQDAVPEDEFLTEELLKPFFEPFCGAQGGFLGETELLISYGRQIPAKGCRLLERYTRRFNYPEESLVKTAADIPELGIKTFFASNVCALYRKNLFLAQGGFPEKTIFNEDMIFAGRAVKAGYGIAYVSSARVVHSHNLSGAAQFHRNFDLAVSQAEHPEVFGRIRSEGEGMKMVKTIALGLINSGNGFLLLALVWTSACKYAGYFLGKRYRKLPRGLVRACSMNKQYWGDERCPTCW
jgi:rhamnosyltransferase